MSTPQQNLPPQAPQPQPQPHYAAPQYAPQSPAPQPQQPLYAPPQQGYASAPASTAERVNIPGIVSLGLVALSTLVSVLSPLFYRSALSSGQSLAPVTGVVQTLQAILLLVALGLAIFGVLLRGAERWRWAAIGALVSASISVAAMALSLIVNLFSAAFPY